MKYIKEFEREYDENYDVDVMEHLCDFILTNKEKSVCKIECREPRFTISNNEFDFSCYIDCLSSKDELRWILKFSEDTDSRFYTFVDDSGYESICFRFKDLDFINSYIEKYPQHYHKLSKEIRNNKEILKKWEHLGTDYGFFDQVKESNETVVQIFHRELEEQINDIFKDFVDKKFPLITLYNIYLRKYDFIDLRLSFNAPVSLKEIGVYKIPFIVPFLSGRGIYRFKYIELLEYIIDKDKDFYKLIPDDYKTKEVIERFSHLGIEYGFFDQVKEGKTQDGLEYKYTDFNYKAVLPDKFGNPDTFITDYKIVKDDGQYITVKATGYKYSKNSRLKRKSLTKFKDKEMRIYKKYIQEGKSRKKIYDIYE